MNGKIKIGLLATVLSVGALAIPGHSYGQAQGGADNGNAQNGGNNNNGGGGGNRGGRGWDPAQMRQRMIDGIKRQLGSTDDEFAAIEPKLTKVMDIQQDLRSGQRFGGFGGRRGGNGGGGNGGGGDAPAPTTPVAIAVKDLQDTIDDKDAKPEDIKPKLDALRDAKTKARADLVAAQKELSEILVQRQEAALVVAGILE